MLSLRFVVSTTEMEEDEPRPVTTENSEVGGSPLEAGTKIRGGRKRGTKTAVKISRCVGFTSLTDGSTLSPLCTRPQTAVSARVKGVAKNLCVSVLTSYGPLSSLRLCPHGPFLVSRLEKLRHS